jgi:hypothetical protein
MQVTASQAISMIAKFIRAQLVPMLVGSPGIGKSSIVHKIAKDYNLKVIDVRLSQCDPTDLLGFPHIMGTKAGYLPMETFPIEGDPIPEGYSGWLLFLDEMNGAPLAVQKAAYKLILDRMVGNHKLHKNVAIVGAGNLDTDNAAVESMSTALQSRLVHMELVNDVEEWLYWAYENGIDHRITSFIKFKPGQLYTFKPDHTDKTYGCNRTWEFANRVLKVTAEDDPDRLAMLAGTLSEGVAREFMGFCKIERDLPKISQIVASPESIKMPEEPSILYALTGAIGQNASPDNLSQLLKFVNRMPKEFQVISLRETVRRNKANRTHPAIREWILTSAVELF